MLASGLMFTFIACCVQMRGPLFVSAFNPLMLLLVAIAGSLVLNESLHLGRYVIVFSLNYIVFKCMEEFDVLFKNI